MRVDVETEFAACIRGMRGTVVDDALSGPNKPKNADFWFPDHNVIAELKCLTTCLTSTPEFNRRVQTLHSSWVKRGLVPRPATSRFTINTAELPAVCSRELLDPVKRRLEVNTLKPANAQIKSLRKSIGTADTKGLLIIANDGDYALPPSLMAHLLARATNNRYSCIHSIIYFSVSETVTAPRLESPSRFWVDALLPGKIPVAKQLRDSLVSAWMAHYSRLFPDEYIVEIDAKRSGVTVQDLAFVRHE
jgi:hypothetical protein